MSYALSDTFIRTYRMASPALRRIIPAKLRAAIFARLKPSNGVYFDAERHHDFSAWEREAFASVAPIICQSPEAAISLIRAVEYVAARNVPGDFVECGAYMGASMVLVAKTLLRHGCVDRRLYLYDTFEGMPKPEEVDVHYTGFRELDMWDRRTGSDGLSTYLRAPIERVRANVLATGYPAALVHLVKGKVEDTIPATLPDQIALLRLDTDYYASTKHELEYLYPRLSPHGVLIVDDYGAFQGARQATDDYFRWSMHLSRVDANVRLAIKP